MSNVNFTYLILSNIFSAFLGWLVASYNLRAAAKRNEVRHACDKIESILTDLVKLTESHFLKQDVIHSAEFFESRANQLVSLVEMRLEQIKNRLLCSFIDVDLLSSLRALLSGEIDLSEETGEEKVINISEHCGDIVEALEQAYTSKFSPTIFSRVSTFLDSHISKIITFLIVALMLGAVMILKWLFSPA
ncbi:hypothetical protein [Endozoicomonas sp. ISHI1]|uniref:hypothetical protein n=1 Tax=Endozoicomonas sp. ISHI1 TaxID=2825882 RepID=UPI0021479B05|nr:hypothetical protein [Endozoicomonas sp. ISHI1]